jgi:HSP20 family protein
MSLIRWQKPELNVWSPFSQVAALHDEINRVFGVPRSFQSWRPTVDFYEDGEQLVLKAELPGVNKSDLELTLHDGVLTLAGERREEKSMENSEVHRSERFLGKFSRSFTLPAAVNAAKVQASFKDGILTVTLPKAEEAKPKHIEVKE